MNLLVTGGAGFMGSNFIRYLLNKYPEYKIINVDKLTYAGNLENLRDVKSNPHYKFVKGDIRENIIDFIVSKADAVVNYAAETHVDRSILSSQEFIDTNVLGTLNVLNACRKHNVRLIQISTDEVYGSIDKGVFTEESPFKPNSPYAASKASGDLLCRAYFKTYGTPVVITHSCNFYGPYQYPEKLIPLVISNILKGKNIPLYGNGKNRREWIFTEDHCIAVDKVLHKGKIGETYNIGSGNEITNLNLVKRIIGLMGKDSAMIDYVADRPGHDKRYRLSTKKINLELNWYPKIGFEEGLKRTIKWYKENKKWWMN